MEQIKQLELKMAEWYKAVPHLPARGQAWLANNIWWIVLVGVILSGLGLCILLLVVLLVATGLVVFGGAIGAALSGILLVAVLINCGFSIVELIFSAMAIGPLKQGQKRGWNYLFAAYLVMVAATIVSFLLHLNAPGLVGLVWNVICLAVIGYFLFEIRSHLLMPQRQYSATNNGR